MAALIINNVLSSSVEISYEYLDTDEIFGYTVEGTYEVDISDINIQQNDTVLLKGRDAIKDAYARPNIVARIGADDYLNGEIQNYSFEKGTLVGAETVSLTLREFRRLDSYASTQFAKYIPNPHTLSSFTENYSFSRNGNDYTSKREIGITYRQMAGGQFLNDAKTFLTNYYFANRPSLGYQEDGISENGKIDKNYRGLISETYDLIGLSVRLTESLRSSFIDDALKVGRAQTQKVDITEQGYKNKTHTISLTSLRVDSENVLTSAIAQIIEDTKTFEYAEFGNPITVTKGITKDGNTAQLTIGFSTDPNKSDNVESYKGAQNKAGKFKEYTLSITYKSSGKDNRIKFLNSKKIWVAGQPLNELRIQRLFHPTVPLYEKNRSTTFDKSKGFIEESVVFTTDDSYKDNDDGVLKFKKTLSKNHQINRISKFLDLTSSEEQVVVKSQKTIGAASVAADVVVSQSMGIYKARSVLEQKTDELTELVDENITCITQDDISLDLGEGTASRKIAYVFLESFPT